MFDSFLKYQGLMRDTFRRLQRTYGFQIVDGECHPDAISEDLNRKIDSVLRGT
jgi:hypothetical protein